MPLLLKGLLIGLLIAMPVGPVAILCIQRTLADGRCHGLVSGLGAAAADSIYGGVAAFSASVISSFLDTHKMLFLCAGGLAVCLLGLRTFLSNGKAGTHRPIPMIHAGDFLAAFTLTLMNPLTVLAFMAVFAASGLGTNQYLSGRWLVLGVFLGSGLWWVTLSLLAGLFRHLVNEEHMSVINKIAGTIIMLFGAAVLLKAGWTGLPTFF